MKPMFSIVIPCYNVAPYVRACLDSVAAQTCADGWEAICVDDGATDGTGAILDEYAAKDARFKVIHQPNAGVSAARNAGLEAATGEWIWFIDSDDTIAPFALAFLTRELGKISVDIFRFANQSVSSQMSAFPSVECPVEGYDLAKKEDVRQAFKNGHAFCFAWDACYRRSLIGETRFRTDLLVGEDQLFGTQMVTRAATLAGTDTVLYNYFQRPGSCMKTMNARQLRSLLDREPLIWDVLRGWLHGDVLLPPLLRNWRAEMSDTLLKIMRLPSAERRAILPRYYELGERLFEHQPFHRLLLRTHCPPLILLILYPALKLRIAVLKLGFVRRIKNWLRGY